MRVAKKSFIAVLLLILHFALHPLWSRSPVGPDLLAGGLVLGAMQFRWGRAAAWGAAIGLLEASISLGPMGRTMLLFTLTGALVAWVRHLIYADSDYVTPAFVFLGTWFVRFAATIFAAGAPAVEVLLVQTGGSAVLTTMACWLADRMVSAVTT